MKYVCEKCGMSFDSITDCQTHEENDHKKHDYVYIKLIDCKFILHDVSVDGTLSSYQTFHICNEASFYIYVEPGDEERGKQMLMDSYKNSIDFWREQGRKFTKLKRELEEKK